MTKRRENRDPALCREFVHTAKGFLAYYQDISHEWSIDQDESHCILTIPKKAEDGFDITVEVFPDEIVLNTDGPHVHFDMVKEPKETVDSVVGAVRDLLSPDMRIMEVCANGKPYKWYIQSLRNGVWKTDQFSSLVFWNFLGKRSERILRNTVLPGRINTSR